MTRSMLIAVTLVILAAPGWAGPAPAQDDAAQARQVNEEVARLHQEARGLAQSNRHDDALRTYRRILQLKPDDLDAMTGLARVTSWKGDLAGAERTYRDVLARKADHADALVGFGDVRSWQKDYAGARRAYEQALAVAPDHVDALKGLGKLARWQGDREGSRRYYAQVLRQAPTDAEARDAMRQLDQR